MTASSFRPLSLASLAVAALALAGASIAAPPSPQAAVTTRQANFKKMGAAMKSLNEQLRSGAPVKATMVAAAQTIAATAREQPMLFPAGSGPAAGLKTDALPAIWSDRAAFDAQMRQLLAESARLAAIANGGDATAIGAQTKATGAVCGACHRQFRADS